MAHPFLSSMLHIFVILPEAAHGDIMEEWGVPFWTRSRNKCVRKDRQWWCLNVTAAECCNSVMRRCYAGLWHTSSSELSTCRGTVCFWQTTAVSSDNQEVSSVPTLGKQCTGSSGFTGSISHILINMQTWDYNRDIKFKFIHTKVTLSFVLCKVCKRLFSAVCSWHILIISELKCSL